MKQTEKNERHWTRVCAHLVLAVAVAAATTGCLFFQDTVGPLDLPSDDATLREIEQIRLSDNAVSEPETIEEGLAEVREGMGADDPNAPVDLTIERMRLLALRNNLDLDVLLLAPAIARTKVSEQEGRFDALVTTKAKYSKLDRPELDGPLVDFSSSNPDLDGEVVKLTELEQEKEKLDLGLGLEIPLTTGGRVELLSEWRKDNLYDPQRFEQYVTATRFSLSQPLLRGAGSRAALAAVRMARADQARIEARTKLSALGVLAKAEKAYWRLYAAQRLMEVREEQYRLAEENLRLVRRRVEQGLSAAIEITRSELGVAARLEDLVLARTRWQLQQRELKMMLNETTLPLEGGPLLQADSEPFLAGLELDREDLVDQALSSRPELIELELGLIRDAIRVGLRENEALPLFNLNFGYGLLERDQAFGSSFREQWDFDNSELFVGVEFEMPLANRTRDARREQAVLERTQRFATREAQRLTIRREVLDAVDVLEQNWQRILASRQRVIVAGVNYDGELRQFQEGFRTMREVFEALSSLGDAQRREILAIVDYQVAQIDVAFATGTLLGYSRVSLDPLPLEP